jgi:D-alanyl-D-alanine dipeptidase
VYVSDVIPDAILEIRYYSTFNFVGARIYTYDDPVAIIAKEAADLLKKASDSLRQKGYIIKIFDVYRPQGAVDHFMRWGRDPNDILTKDYFYPELDKATEIDPNVTNTYIASTSGHSRGYTVDLTLVNMKTGKEVDMGSPFDYFGPLSDHRYGNRGRPEENRLTQEHKDNRAFLLQEMEAVGFARYNAEWWHYSVPGRNTTQYPIQTFPVRLDPVTSWPGM